MSRLYSFSGQCQPFARSWVRVLTDVCDTLVKSAHSIEWNPGPFHGQKPNLYVKIHLDGEQIGRTRTAKRTIAPVWNEPFPILSENLAAEISLKLFHDTSVPMREDPCVGSVDIQINSLVNLSSTVAGEISQFIARVGHAFCLAASLQLVAVEGPSKGKPSGSLLVHMRIETSAQVKIAIDDTINAVAARGLGSVNPASTANDFSSKLKAVTTKLELVIKFGDTISEINPYAKAAWRILTFVYEAVQKQQDTDEKVQELVETMVEVYSFVDDVESLPHRIKRLEDVLIQITKQTLECAIFIREYTGHGFAGRLFRTNVLNTSQKIDGLSGALLKLKDSFDHGLAMQNIFFSTKLNDAVESLVQSDKLKALNPLNLDASLCPECLAGTRQDVLTAITNWLTTPSTETNILWLHGVAGAGKSTILTTVSQYFRDLHRLGGFIFFDRNNPAESSPGRVICTLAYNMSMVNPYIREAICQVIKDDPLIATAPMRTQVQKLLLGPLAVAQDHILGPIIVVLDALDECGDSNSREGLVSLLAGEFSKLPPVFRFLITSRLESDIAGQFRGQQHITEMQLDITTQATKHDITVYLEERMRNIRQFKRSLEADWPGHHIINTLAYHSGGLFIWAVTACKFIKSFDPKRKLAIILDAGLANNLDALYTVALQNSADWSDESFAQVAHSVLGAVVLSRVPLTDWTIDKLFGYDRGRSAEVLEYLGCVVQWSPGEIARILHTSFSDYLTDHHRSGLHPWFVDSKIQSRSLALGCLQILKLQLSFNICKLKNSHILNVTIPDLSDRIATYISTELRYASLFWAYHLSNTETDREILSILEAFMTNQFLYWLEVLSLLNEVPVAIQSLKYVQNCTEALQNDIADALRFLAGFAPLIAQSVPHIYISGLPFSPSNSLVYKRFTSSFPQTLHFTGPLGTNWSTLLKAFHGHTDWVLSLVFSPNGKQIVSGSKDHTVRVWDAETGTELICIQTNYQVHTVAFSPDGCQIMSGGEGIHLWDSQTGSLNNGPLGDVMVLSAAFSPNGKWLASCGFYRKEVQLRDSTTGTLVGTFEGHTDRVNSVIFSPDGKRVATGATDCTVRVWDTATQALTTGPCVGHIACVSSVAFSPDGEWVASGSDDRTLRVWDSVTGIKVAGPFEGHTDHVTSIAFSPNGNQIVSGSDDHTVIIWDSRTCEVVAGPFMHPERLMVVVFSLDGKHILSGCRNQTIRMWDAEIAAVDFEQVPGHGESVASVSFSPDGQLIASGSKDGTVQLWNSTTGTLVLGPLEHTEGVSSTSFSLDGKHIASVNGWKLQTWDCETGLVVSSFEERTMIFSAITFLPDGLHVVLCVFGSGIKTLNYHTGSLVSTLLEGHTPAIDCVAFSPNREQMASGSNDNTVRIWDFKSGALIVGPILGHTYPIPSRGLAFSPDGKTVASGSHDKTVRIWDSRTGASVLPPFEHPLWVTSIAFSPDGTQIVSGSGDMAVGVWDTKTGDLVAGPFEGHTSTVNSVAFSPDGKQIVSGSVDASIRVWQVRNALGSIIMDFHPRFVDGWLMNSSSEHILWVPPWLRDGLWLPWNSLVIRSRGTTKLDLSRFVHGTDWGKCIEGTVQSNRGKAVRGRIE
ncbi:WD40-repeat-containing domain protein [Mycena haematopus]|nr:WD40-repeat-containing domain protein [Mycena haematopus]